MSDIDRLRLAADRLEQPYWQRTTLTAIQQNSATAALLRAVADESSNIEWITRTMSDGHPSLCVSGTWKAALALADTILGDVRSTPNTEHPQPVPDSTRSSYPGAEECNTTRALPDSSHSPNQSVYTEPSVWVTPAEGSYFIVRSGYGEPTVVASNISDLDLANRMVAALRREPPEATYIIKRH